jgi:hypothetical protein
VLDVNEPVLIVRPDDDPIGPKHVALYVLLIVLIDVLDKNINILFKQKTAVLYIHLDHIYLNGVRSSLIC